MKVLFLTMVKINSFADRGIYTDLLRKFYEEGHDVFAVCPVERREKKKTYITKEKEGTILNVQTLNLQKTNIIEKGIGTLAIEFQFLNAIKKYFANEKFDVIIYSTPPITFAKVINFIKKRDNAYSYLLLKDIFPQNAVDMKMLKQDGTLHKLFVKKEQKLYAISDTIGCMSQANKDFILNHNPSIDSSKVEINPNTIQPIQFNENEGEKKAIKLKYNLPLDKKIFVYGGNLGKPQGIDFLLETITNCKVTNAFFLIVGTGTEFDRIQNWFQTNTPQNAILLQGLPKRDYDQLLQFCDFGMLFLNKNFTIPNFPSRLLSYLEMQLPVIAATDAATDIGTIVEKNGCGYKVISGDSVGILAAIEKLATAGDSELQEMKKNTLRLLEGEYHVDKSYQLIIEKIKNV